MGGGLRLVLALLLVLALYEAGRGPFTGSPRPFHVRRDFLGVSVTEELTRSCSGAFTFVECRLECSTRVE